MSAKDDRPYVRLTRSASGVGTNSSLWLGDGHLMVVTTTGYADTYSRVELRDIKGFFITGGSRQTWWTIVWAGLIVAFGIPFANVEGAAAIFPGACLVVSVIGLIWNHVLGPGCRVHVVTGVQTARLPALVRRKKVDRVLSELQPLIEAAQADLVAARAATTKAPVGSTTPPLPAAAPAGQAVAQPAVREAAAPAPPPPGSPA